MNIRNINILGGMSHFNGVTFFGRNYNVKAVLNNDQKVIVKVFENHKTPNFINEMFNVPLIRGFAELLYGIITRPLSGVFMLLAPILLNLRITFISNSISLTNTPDYIIGFISGLLSTTLLIGIFLKFATELPKYHAAEHVLHNLYINDNSLAIDNFPKKYRFHKWCGSNWTASLILYTLIMFFIPIPSIIKIIIWFSFYGELIHSKNSFIITILKPFYSFGRLIQRLTTSDPNEKHLRVARVACQTLLDLETKKTNNLT